MTFIEESKRRVDNMKRRSASSVSFSMFEHVLPFRRNDPPRNLERCPRYIKYNPLTTPHARMSPRTWCKLESISLPRPSSLYKRIPRIEHWRSYPISAQEFWALLHGLSFKAPSSDSRSTIKAIDQMYPVVVAPRYIINSNTTTQAKPKVVQSTRPCPPKIPPKRAPSSVSSASSAAAAVAKTRLPMPSSRR